MDLAGDSPESNDLLFALADPGMSDCASQMLEAVRRRGILVPHEDRVREALRRLLKRAIDDDDASLARDAVLMGASPSDAHLSERAVTLAWDRDTLIEYAVRMGRPDALAAALDAMRSHGDLTREAVDAPRGAGLRAHVRGLVAEARDRRDHEEAA